jgi:hypothetical protein
MKARTMSVSLAFSSPIVFIIYYTSGSLEPNQTPRQALVRAAIRA